VGNTSADGPVETFDEPVDAGRLEHAERDRARGRGERHRAGNGELDDSLTGDFKVQVTSLREARFKTIILQQFDYSCGSAAVASLLTYDDDRPSTGLLSDAARRRTARSVRRAREGIIAHRLRPLVGIASTTAGTTRPEEAEAP
jgi:hypothetical protein